MMITIRGLPLSTKYHDVKLLLKGQCKLDEFILDNLISDENDGSKKVRVGLVTEGDGLHIIKVLNGFRIADNHLLRVETIGKPPPTNQSNYEHKPSSSYAESRSNYPNPHNNDSRVRNTAPSYKDPYTSHGPTNPGGHRPVTSQMPCDPLGGPSSWVLNTPNTQWSQNQPSSQNSGYQQPSSPGYRPQYPSHSQRSDIGVYPQGRTQPGQEYISTAKTNVPDMGILRKPMNRPHVLRSVDLVDTANVPVQTGRYPTGQSFQQQQKPITIMKDNFQGPSNQEVGSEHPSSSYYRQGQSSSQSWSQMQKPQVYPKPGSGQYEKPYGDIHRQEVIDKRPDLRKNVQQPMRTDIYKDLEKPGPRFDLNRPMADGRLSPTRRVKSPERAAGPRSAQGRRISPSRRLLSPTRKLISPSDRMMSSIDRRPGGPPSVLTQRPHERIGRGDVPRFSPQRHYPERQIDKDMEEEPVKSTKRMRQAYDVTDHAPSQGMYSSGYRSNIHENEPYARGNLQSVQDLPWQQEGDPRQAQMYTKMKKRVEDGFMEKHSPRNSRSPIRRNRSPIRDRFRRLSPSSRSPRRSWAFEKRRSPEVGKAPPPPNWPGQENRDDTRYKDIPDRKDGSHVLNWDRPAFTKIDDSKRLGEDLDTYVSQNKPFRGNFEMSRAERFPEHQRDDAFDTRNEFESRNYRQVTDNKPKPYSNKQALEYGLEHENTHRLNDLRRKNSPLRDEVKDNNPRKLGVDIENVYRRSQEFRKKTEEQRKVERRVDEHSQERSRSLPRPHMDVSPRRRQVKSPLRRGDNMSSRRIVASPRRRIEVSPRLRGDASSSRRGDDLSRHRGDDLSRHHGDDLSRHRRDASSNRRADASPRSRKEQIPRRHQEPSPRRRTNESPRRRKEESPRYGKEESPRRRKEVSPRRRKEESPKRGKPQSSKRRRDQLPSRHSDREIVREPIWEVVDKNKKLNNKTSLTVRAKREKATHEISRQLIERQPISDKLDPLEKTRILDKMKIFVSYKLTELFDDQDLSFIELVIKFKSRVSDADKDKMFNDVLKFLPGKYRDLKTLGSDTTDVNKKSKYSSDQKLRGESPEPPIKKLKISTKIKSKEEVVLNKTEIHSPNWTLKDDLPKMQAAASQVVSTSPNTAQVSTLQLTTSQLKMSQISTSQLSQPHVKAAQLTTSHVPTSQLALSQIITPQLSNSQLVPSQMVPSQLVNSQLVPSQLSNSQSLSSQMSNTQSVPSQMSNTQSVPSQMSNSQSMSSQMSNTQFVLSQMSNTQLVPSQSMTSRMSNIQLVPSQMSNTQLMPLQMTNTQLVPSQMSNKQLMLSQMSNTPLMPSQMSNTPLMPSQMSNTPLMPSQLVFSQRSNSQSMSSQISNSQSVPSQISNSQLILSQMSNSQLMPSQISQLQLVPLQMSNSQLTLSQLSNSQLLPSQMSNSQLMPAALASTKFASTHMGVQLPPPQVVIPTLSTPSNWLMVAPKFENSGTSQVYDFQFKLPVDHVHDLFLCQDNFDSITDAQATTLKKYIVSEIEKVIAYSQNWAPDFTFKGLQSMRRYVLSTSDEASKDWLMNLDFNGFNLFNVLVYTREELWYERAAIWLPGHSKHRNFKPLDKLRLQNKKLDGVNVDKWKFVKKIVSFIGTKLYVDMPPSSARALEKHNMMLSYELQKVNVFLRALAVDKESFDNGLKEKSITDEAAIKRAALESFMPIIQNSPSILKVQFDKGKDATIEQARIFKENIIYNIFKHQSMGDNSKIDFVKFGYIFPHCLGVVPENMETKKWLMNTRLGDINHHNIIVKGGDDDTEFYFGMTVKVPNEPNITARLVVQKLKMSNQSLIKDINFHLWKPIRLKLFDREKDKVMLYVDLDSQSVETLIRIDFNMDYVSNYVLNVVKFESEMTKKQMKQRIKKFQMLSYDNNEIANMEIDSDSEDV